MRQNSYISIKYYTICQVKLSLTQIYYLLRYIYIYLPSSKLFLQQCFWGLSNFFLVVYYLYHWSQFFPLICSIQGFLDRTSKPSSAPHYGNLTSSRWVVKGTLERTFEKAAYALYIRMLVREKRWEGSSHKRVDENPQQDNHSCLNWNITDNSIIILLYMWKTPWYMALSQNLISVWKAAISRRSARGVGWLMPPYIQEYVIRESYDQ